MAERRCFGPVIASTHTFGPRRVSHDGPNHRGGSVREFFGSGAEIVLHCAGGDRSVLAAAELTAMGYLRVAHLDGGFGAWAATDQPIEDVSATSKWIRRP